jgi:urease accessory protein
VQIIASDEELFEIKARDQTHLTQLAWHIGNRHLEAQIEATRILIRSDYVIAKLLEQLGATVTLVHETFTPENGAYAHDH